MIRIQRFVASEEFLIVAMSLVLTTVPIAIVWLADAGGVVGSAG